MTNFNRSVVYSISTEIPFVGYYNYQSHSVNSPGIWYDVAQLSCPFTSWESGEPNNNGGAENCVRLVMSSTSYMMEDVSCSLTPKVLYCMTRPTGKHVFCSTIYTRLSLTFVIR